MRNETTERFLARAYMAASRSTDPSSQVGAVAVDMQGNLAVAWNHIPAASGVHMASAARDQKLRCVLHAEATAVNSMNGRPIDTLYATAYACEQCASWIIRAGVKRVVGHAFCFNVWQTSTGWLKSIEAGHRMLRSAGVHCEWYEEPVAGTPIRVGGKLIDPLALTVES